MVVNEFVRLDNVEEIKDEIRQMNYKLLSAINDTNVIEELEKEKKRAINEAAVISKMLIPEVKLLNSFVNEDDIPKPGRRGRPKKVVSRPLEMEDTIEQIKKRGPGRPRKAKRGRGRPRKIR